MKNNSERLSDILSWLDSISYIKSSFGNISIICSTFKYIVSIDNLRTNVFQETI